MMPQEYTQHDSRCFLVDTASAAVFFQWVACMPTSKLMNAETISRWMVSSSFRQRHDWYRSCGMQVIARAGTSVVETSEMSSVRTLEMRKAMCAERYFRLNSSCRSCLADE